MTLTCFKAYDVRGQLDTEITENIVYRIGRAFGQLTNAKRIAIGGDARATSESLKQAAIKGLLDAGVDAIDIGMTGTEEVYFAAFHLDVEGGIEITASHNPIDYNGMKFVGKGATPIVGEDLQKIHDLAESQKFIETSKSGALSKQSILIDYVNHLLGYINLDGITPLKLVVNAGNGAAGHVIDAIEEIFNKQGVPIEFIKIHHAPDPTFPNGIPNPILPENQVATSEAIKKHNAHMGIAWDGDFDRCFLFDEKGTFVDGYYVVGLLAAAFLKKSPGEKIIHDPRLVWNTIEITEQHGGKAIQAKTGHAFLKQRMRDENAMYGGEMSAHHYFRDFAYCDSGMIPWLLVTELMCQTKLPLSKLVSSRIEAFPCSGERNFKVRDAQGAIDAVCAYFKEQEDQPMIDATDGTSMSFSQWRFNIRSSNTEPLLRVNVETRGDKELVVKKTNLIASIIQKHE